MFPELGVMVGYAATATIRAQSRGESREAALWAHVLSLPAPRVVVVQDLDEPPAQGAMWGEVQSNILRALGCVGAVTDGCVRDLNEARELGFHFFARGPGVSHAYVHVTSAGEPVTVGGLTVHAGDLVHADQHGVLLIPPELARELPAAADRVIEREQTFLRWVRSSEFDPDRLGAAFSGLGVGPLPRLALPAEEDELRDFLHQNAVQPPSAGGLTPDT